MKKVDLVRDYIREHPDEDVMHIHHKMVEKYPEVFNNLQQAYDAVRTVRDHGLENPRYLKTKKQTQPIGVLSKEEFIEKYDLRSIIFAELRKLKKDVMVPDSVLVQRFRGKPGYRTILQSPEAKPFYGKALGGGIWWSHQETIHELKEEGRLI